MEFPKTLARFAPFAIGLTAVCAALTVCVLGAGSAPAEAAPDSWSARHGSTADWFGVLATMALLWLTLRQFKTQTEQTNMALQHAAAGLAETRAQRRAWVGPDKFRNLSFELHHRGRFFVWLRNTGLTPALDMTHQVMLTVVPSHSADKFVPRFNFDSVANPEPLSRGTMFPGEDVATMVDVPKVDGQLLGGVRSGALLIFLQGRVTYRDPTQSADEPDRVTEYCVRWAAEQGPKAFRTFHVGNRAT